MSKENKNEYTFIYRDPRGGSPDIKVELGHGGSIHDTIRSIFYFLQLQTYHKNTILEAMDDLVQAERSKETE